MSRERYKIDGSMLAWSRCDCTLQGCIEGDAESSVIKGTTKAIHTRKFGLIWASKDYDNEDMWVYHQFEHPSILEQEMIALELKKKRKRRKK